MGPKATTVPEYGDLDHAGDNEEGEAVGSGHLLDRFRCDYMRCVTKGEESRMTPQVWATSRMKLPSTNMGEMKEEQVGEHQEFRFRQVMLET